MFSKERHWGESDEGAGRKPGGLTGSECALPSDLVNGASRRTLRRAWPMPLSLGTWGVACDTCLRSVKAGNCGHVPQGRERKSHLERTAAWVLESLKVAHYGRPSLRKRESDSHGAPCWAPPGSRQGLCK